MLSTSPQPFGINTAVSLPVPINTSTTPTPDSLSNQDAISLSTENQMKEDFLALAKTGQTRNGCQNLFRRSFRVITKVLFLVLSSLKTLTFGLSTERERLKTALDLESTSNVNQSVVNLRNNLNQVVQQNAELKNRLSRIHEVSDLSDLSSLELTENVRFYAFFLLSLDWKYLFKCAQSSVCLFLTTASSL